MTKYCSQCGKPSSDQMQYCSDCGTKLDDPVSDQKSNFLDEKEVKIASILAILMAFVFPIIALIVLIGLIGNIKGNTIINKKDGYIVAAIIGIIISIAMIIFDFI